MKTDEGTKEEESKESPAEETEEDSGAGVVIPEEFQTQVSEILSSATKPMLSFIRDAVYAKEDELRKAEEAKRSKGSKKGVKTPPEFSSSDMPS